VVGIRGSLCSPSDELYAPFIGLVQTAGSVSVGCPYHQANANVVAGKTGNGDDAVRLGGSSRAGRRSNSRISNRSDSQIGLVMPRFQPRGSRPNQKAAPIREAAFASLKAPLRPVGTG